MKSLPYIALLILGIQSVYADTLTTGRIKLIIPTTGYVDVTKRIDVKFNENFTQISTGLNYVETEISTNTTYLTGRLDNLDNSTSTIQTNINGISNSTKTFGLFYATAPAIIEGSRLFLATYTAGSASTSSWYYGMEVDVEDSNTVAITFKEMDIMGNFYQNGSTKAVMTKTGIGGIDTGSEASGTWYKVFLLSNGSTCSVVLSSVNVLNPVMPTGYTKFRCVGTIYNDTSSDLRLTVSHTPYGATLYTERKIYSADPGAAAVQYSLTDEIPPEANWIAGEFYVGGGAATADGIILYGNGCTNVAKPIAGNAYLFQRGAELLGTPGRLDLCGDRSYWIAESDSNTNNAEIYLRSWGE